MAFAGLGFMLQACTGLTAIKLSTTYRGQFASHKKVFFSPFALGKFDARRMPRSESD